MTPDDFRGGDAGGRVSVPGRGREWAFRVAAGITGAFLLVMMLPTYPLLFTNWLPADAWLAVRPDRSPGDQVHRLHSLALGLISWGMLVGVAVQFRRPKGKLGALLMTLATVVAVGCALTITGTFSLAGIAPFLLLTLVTCALHPSARAIVRWPRLDLPMLALAAVAAVPWVTWALRFGAAARGAEPGDEFDHLGFMVTTGLLIPLWALLGATDKPGWAFPAGAALLATACVALQSLIFRDALSGLDPVWATGALAWCVVYGSAARVRSRRAQGRAGLNP